MGLRIEFTPEADQDLDAIHGYIAKFNPPAARRVVARILNLVREDLERFPELGFSWREGPTRALKVAGLPYRIHYLILDDRLIILRVLHTSRLPPARP